MKKSVLSLLLVSALFIQGCGATENSVNIESLQNNAKRGSLNVTDGKTKNYKYNSSAESNQDLSDTENTDQQEFEHENKSVEERAKYISEQLLEFSEINNASVVITGNTAIVGINVKNDIDDSKILDLKYEVEARVKSIDSKIDHVAVSAAPELFERITNMAGQNDKEKEELEQNDNDSENNHDFSKVAPTI